MPWKALIATVDRTADLDLASQVEIVLRHNDRATAAFVARHGYRPDLGAEVVLYDQDGVTALFGGIVFDRRTVPNHALLRTHIDCTDYSVYLDVSHVTETLTGVYTMKAVIQLLIANYLSAYGITLAAGQVDGPSATLTGFTWFQKPMREVFADITKYTSYVYTLSPTKVLQFVLPNLASPTAPFTITDADANARELNWSDSRRDYATKILLRCGGTGTRELSQTWTVNAGHVAAGYLETDVPSTPTGGVSATVNGAAVTVGATGSQLRWEWETHRLYAGTLTPALNDVIILTYTGQYPFTVTATSGASPAWEKIIEAPDVSEKAIADTMVAELLTQYNQAAKTFTIDTLDAGLRPAQVITIDRTDRAATSTSGQISEVRITLVSNTFWKYSATAVSGKYSAEASPLAVFRAFLGQRIVSAVSSFTSGINANAASTGVSPIYLGGSLTDSLSVTPAAWRPVFHRVRFVAPVSFTGRLRVWGRARNATVTVNARLVHTPTDELGTGTSVGTISSVITATGAESANQERTSGSLTITAGLTYELQVLSSANGEGIYLIGILEPVSISA